MDTKKLKKLVQTLITLKAKLKCPICLDVMQDIVELDCSHKFCKDCYLQHKSTQKKPSCPLCKKILKRRSITYSDKFGNSLGKFVHNCCENLRSVYNCEVEQLQKRLEGGLEFPTKNTNVLKRNLTNNSSIPVASTSKVTKNVIKQITTKRNTETTDKKEKPKKVKENYKDAFDELLNAEPTFNKKGTKRVYVNKNKSETKPDVEYSILEFDNIENRTAVLQWLHDTRNKFDRLSQTQTIVNEGVPEAPVIDLVSISQAKASNSEPKPITSKLRRGRAKSLDIEIKNAKPVQVKRKSLGCSVNLEDYNIEDVDTEEEVVKKVEEKVLLDFIEDEYLDTLEDEMQYTKDTEYDIKSKRNKKPKKKGKQPNPTSTTGWDRLTKMEKTLKKQDKTPKQLNVTLQSTQDIKNESKVATKLSDKQENVLETTNFDVSKRILVVDLPRTDFAKDSTNILQKQNEKAEVENKSRPLEKNQKIQIENVPEEKEIDTIVTTKNQRQSYDLEKLELYIEQNMKIINKNNSEDNSTLHENMDMDEQDLKQRKSENHSKETDKEINDSSCVLLDVLFNTPTPKISQRDLQPKDESEIIIITDDVPEIQPKQDEPTKKNTFLDEITNLYTCATQKSDYNCKDSDPTDVFIGAHNSLEDLLRLFETGLEKCITNFKSADTVVEQQLRSLRLCFSKIKSLAHKSSNEIVPEKIGCQLYNVETQTVLDVHHKINQTEYNGNSIGVQTQDLQKKINRQLNDIETQTVLEVDHKINQTENNGSNIGVQSEGLRCLKCNFDLNENKVPEDVKVPPQNITEEPKVDVQLEPGKKTTPHSKQPSQNDVFTCTLDNLNFETQEITKNQGTVTKVSPRKRSPDKPHNEITENIPGSVLVCSLTSNKTPTSKKVNRKLTYGADKSVRFKRIRQPTSDSDSDDDITVKRKCNRFLRDDLTVEFLTNTKGGGTNKSLESPDSCGINYDEYLAEVMKKYDETNCSTSSPSGFKKPNDCSPNQEAIERCEEMINNANRVSNRFKSITELSTTSSKDSYRTASGSIICNSLEEDPLNKDNVFMDEDNLQKFENDIREYEKGSVKAQNSEISDIISETEELEPSVKKFKKTHKSGRPLKRTESDDLNFQNRDILNDSFDEVDTQNLLAMAEAQTDFSKKEGRVNVLANVKIKSQDKEVAAREDDMFSDEDIVETTPQKKVEGFAERSNQSQLSTSVNFKNNVLPTPLTETENFEFDIVPLPPPLDFQDDILPHTPEAPNKENDPIEDHTDSLNKSSLTPDNLSQFIKKDVKITKMSQILTPRILQFSKEADNTKTNILLNLIHEKEAVDKFTQSYPEVRKKKISHSTPFIEVDLTEGTETLFISPIPPVKKPHKTGITEMVQEAKYTPLKFTTKLPSQKQSMLTSTPGQKSMWNYVKPSQSTDEEAPVAETKPCIAGTRLTKDQVKFILQLTHKKLATYNPQFDSSVTHMIVMADDQNCVNNYTIKFVSAVAAGIWVLKLEWVEECLSKSRIVPEEPFEVLDISGFPGPRTSRLTRKENPLFEGYKFFCAEPFVSTTRKEIEDILKMLGGKVLGGLKGLLEDDNNMGLIIGEGHSSQDFVQYEKWVDRYRAVTVDLEWLSKCVGQYKILSIRPYIWCSEDNLTSLGYPEFLTETVPLSFTETF